jgi:hypothetical protein
MPFQLIETCNKKDAKMRAVEAFCVYTGCKEINSTFLKGEFL